LWEHTMTRNDDFRIRPGRIRSTRAPRTKPFLAQALQAAQKAGGLSRGGGSRGGGFGRGRAASFAATRLLQGRGRGAMVKARVVRRMRSPGSLRAHLGYLQRDGVTRDGSPGNLFDAAGDDADGRAFAERCEDDRHHFRFIVSPDEASELASLRSFTRELMDQVSRDLGTRLDWVAIDHWNTDPSLRCGAALRRRLRPNAGHGSGPACWVLAADTERIRAANKRGPAARSRARA
jgi:hypothetical protein